MSTTLNIDDELAEQLEAATVVCHPSIVGELACGNLKNRREILGLLETLCTCPVARHEEILQFVESSHLMGVGLGYIDAHLLASARLGGLPLWAMDRSLQAAASRLRVAWSER